jgi:23S rRNA (pseudouridine1915-N3)-methyltransferase
MKVQLVALGQKMPQWVQAGFDEYIKRLPKDLSFKLIELPLAQRGKNTSVERVMQQEADAILNYLNPQAWLVALAVEGKSWDTPEWARHLSAWREEHKELVFVIGGPDGLDARVMARANAAWSLSALTLPHPLVRIVWAEQLYRACSLLAGHPYHK